MTERFVRPSLPDSVGLLILALLMPGWTLPAAAQVGVANGRDAGNGLATVRLYLDCPGRDTCDRDFIRTELDYIDHVREQGDADVHVLITTQRNASGGVQYTIAFLGRRRFETVSDTLQYSSMGTDTGDERRRGLTQMIALGLTPYLVRTDLARRLRLGVERGPVTSRPIREVDPWDFWIFNLGVSGSFEGEESRTNYRGRGNVSANRTTEDWIVRLSARGDYRESRFNLDDTTIVSTQRDGNLFAFGAKSLGPRWSLGASTNASTSTRNNTRYSLNAGPAIEFNLFPYSESTRRELRFQYEWDVTYVEYEQETIFGRVDETLLSHGFEIRLDLRQPWGGAQSGLEIKHYLTNFDTDRTKFYSIQLEGGMNVRLIRGLSVNMGGEFNFIHDQLYLPNEDASDEDVLLGTVRLKTAYDYRLEVGLNYSFGSIYNNVVNPRFGF